jgi:hypothetical protein
MESGSKGLVGADMLLDEVRNRYVMAAVFSKKNNYNCEPYFAASKMLNSMGAIYVWF